MKNSLRCCISCILAPCCTALDVIRIVHSDGHVEEITHTVFASDIMKAHPKHILKKPTSRSPLPSDASTSIPRIVVVPPEAELKRGKIYFLIPDHDRRQKFPVINRKKLNSVDHNQYSRRRGESEVKEKMRVEQRGRDDGNGGESVVEVGVEEERVTDKCEMDRIRPLVAPRTPNRGRVAVWRPCLESIGESVISSAADSVTSTISGSSTELRRRYI